MRHWIACLTCTVGLASSANPQGTYATLNGYSSTDRFGSAVADVGDLNLDGYNEFVVGTQINPGAAHLYNGQDRSLITSWPGQNGDYQGLDAASAGDFDNDGTPDIAVGAPFYHFFQPNNGRAQVFSGATFGTLLDLVGVPGEKLGWSLQGVEDVDNDGWDDLVVGAPEGTNPPNAAGSGRVLVISGQTQATLTVLPDPMAGWPAGSRFGYCVDGIGDINTDGFADFIVGAPGTTIGKAEVYLGGNTVSPNPHFSLVGPQIGDAFGQRVAGLGDITGDGIPDFAVGMPLYDGPGGTDAGAVTVYSGADATPLVMLYGSAARGCFGTSIAPIGDIDGNGCDDFAVGEPSPYYTQIGLVHVIDGCSFSTIHTFRGGSANDNFGSSVGGLVDITGDGLPELLIGALSEGGSAQGRVYIMTYDYTLKPSCPKPSFYCVSSPNSTGQSATISWSGSTAISAGNFNLLAHAVPPSSIGLFFYGFATQQIPFGNGTLCIQPPIFRLLPPIQTGTGTAGPYLVDFTAPPAGGGGPGKIHPGIPAYFQFWFRDKLAGGAAYDTTDGLEVIFCP